MSRYRKHCYGLDSKRFASFRKALEQEDRETSEIRLPCHVLPVWSFSASSEDNGR